MKLDIRCDIEMYGIEEEECRMIAEAILESMVTDNQIQVDFGLLKYTLRRDQDEVVCIITKSSK
tara:strand:- start:649 stop:840 length:192 start_codon:yes stop_codon:yes gene_type:complete